MPDKIKVPPLATVAAKWAQNTTKWAYKRAAQGQLTEPLPSPLWVFDLDLRKVSRYSRHSAQIRLGQDHLKHLGVQVGDYIRLIPRKDGTLTIRRATAKDLRQANPYTRLTAVPNKRSKKVAF